MTCLVSTALLFKLQKWLLKMGAYTKLFCSCGQVSFALQVYDVPWSNQIVKKKWLHLIKKRLESSVTVALEWIITGVSMIPFFIILTKIPARLGAKIIKLNENFHSMSHASMTTQFLKHSFCSLWSIPCYKWFTLFDSLPEIKIDMKRYIVAFNSHLELQYRLLRKKIVLMIA